ncbi:hypothetical protein [Maritalea porphyrae]|uniref:hypothetical protein n=1 Tax=Maritalea porphyrae TaxID=880732 RepID=UPI0022AF90E8|nr:hypothetical protein [Maritalea porphyrae]
MTGVALHIVYVDLSSLTPKAAVSRMVGIVSHLHLSKGDHQMIQRDQSSFDGVLEKGIEGFSTPGYFKICAKT